MRVKGFAAICSTDSHGKSLHQEVKDKIFVELKDLASKIQMHH